MFPVDFSLVHADDEYLDALGAGRPDADRFGGDEIAALLLAWRDAVDAEPIHQLVALDLAVATLRAAMRRQGCA